MKSDLGSRVGHAVGHVAYEAAHVAVLDELRHALRDIIEEAHGVSQEVHGAQDLGCLADQFLRSKQNAKAISIWERKLTV